MSASYAATLACGTVQSRNAWICHGVAHARAAKVLLAATLVTALRAEEQSSQIFDVASIKPSDPSTYGHTSESTAHGSLSAQGVTVKGLIGKAYDVHPLQIDGLPKWAGPKFREAKNPEDILSSGTSIHNGNMIATNISMAMLANTLTGQLDRIVVDKTNLMERYDLSLA